MEKLKEIALRIVELLLFFFALGFLVPPIPSDDKTVYSVTPVLIIGGGAFAVSLLLAMHRRAEHWATVVLKLVFYCMLACIIHQRVFGVR